MEMERPEVLQIDREDLFAVLRLRFGEVPGDVAARIHALEKREALERLILVAANVPDWDSFVREFEEGADAFRMVGERFNPLSPNRERQGTDAGTAGGTGEGV